MTAVTKTTQSCSPASACLSPEGGSFVVPLISANWTSREKSEEIERKPDRHQDRYRGHGDDDRSFRHFGKHLRKFRFVYFLVGSHLGPPGPLDVARKIVAGPGKDPVRSACAAISVSLAG